MKILQRLLVISSRKNTSNTSPLSFGPFNSATQIRWKKPADTAQTRLENRIRDLKLDRITAQHCQLNLILSLHRLVSAKKRGHFISVQSLSKWAPHAGIKTLTAGALLRKYPHVFEVFTHPAKHNRCCRFTSKFVGLIREEEDIIAQLEEEAVVRIKKLLLMSVNGTLHLHALRMTRNELGLPENFRESIIRKFETEFKMVDLEIVELVDRDTRSPCFAAEVEKWREKEYTDRWLSEFEVKYAFPINFPTGFMKAPGFREKLRNWQRLSYVKPYERMEVVKLRTCGGVERYEKRAVGIIHELLSLTIEKMVPVERLVHFRKDLGIEVNIRELLLKHPGIFYISTKGNTQLVYLREAYSKGSLIEPNPVYDVRRKLLELMLMGSRNTRELKLQREVKDDIDNVKATENRSSSADDDFVIPILESFDDQ
nr:protein ROOT PRIMORDIUM DEFECTIVE 1 [Ipomoea trifida]